MRTTSSRLSTSATFLQLWRIARNRNTRARSRIKQLAADCDSISTGDHQKVFVLVAMQVGRYSASRLCGRLDDGVRAACGSAVDANRLSLTLRTVKPDIALRRNRFFGRRHSYFPSLLGGVNEI